MASHGHRLLIACVFLYVSLSGFGQSTSSALSDFRTLKAGAEKASAENHTADAVRLYRQALKLNPAWKEGWWGLGTNLYDEGEYREAEQAFMRLSMLDKSNGSARLFLGLCEFELGEDSAALTNIRAARELGILDDPQLRNVALYDEALLELKKSAFETAMQTLKLLTAEDGDSPEVKLAWGLAMLRRQQLPPLESPDRAIVLRIGEAQELAVRKQFEAAKGAYQLAVDSAPTFPGIHNAYGRFLLDTHAVEEAISEFKKEIANDPRNVVARLQIAAAYYRTDSAAGLPFAEQAVRLDPTLPFAHYLLGLLYLDVADAPKAIPELEIAQKAFPNEAKIYFALGNAYAKVGRKEDASRARANFVRLDRAGSQQTGANVYGEQSSSVAPQEIEGSTEKPH